MSPRRPIPDPGPGVGRIVTAVGTDQEPLYRANQDRRVAMAAQLVGDRVRVDWRPMRHRSVGLDATLTGTLVSAAILNSTVYDVIILRADDADPDTPVDRAISLAQVHSIERI